MIRLIFFLIVSLCSIYTNGVVGQNKIEKESRIRHKDVPPKAKSFVDSLNLTTKIKWYIEEGLSGKSIESKFKFNRQKYSVEFDTLGNVEDIEVVIANSDIGSAALMAINEQLKQEFLRFKIIKIQKQFSGNESDLFLLVKNGIVNEGVNIKYEMVVRCKGKKEVNLFEYLFTADGLVETKSKIVFKNSSHLEY